MGLNFDVGVNGPLLINEMLRGSPRKGRIPVGCPACDRAFALPARHPLHLHLRQDQCYL